MPKIAIVILNWNGKEFLEKFLPFVIKHSAHIAEVIVADNNSSDNSIDFLKKDYPSIRVIQHDKNYGFAKGYNLALMQVKADYYILLNSDVEVTENWIAPIMKLMESDATIAACQPKLLSFDERNKFEYAGAAGGFIDKYGYPFCRGRLFQSLEEDTGQYNDTAEIFWATGACMFVKANLYHEQGGLDDDFFAHMEEIDFCWRVKALGYKVMYCPDSTVYHVGGGTLPKKSPMKTYLNIRNNIVMLYKNLPGNRLISVLLKRLFLDFIASLKFLVDGGIKDFFAVYRAYTSVYFKMYKHRKKRKAIQQKEVSKVFRNSIVFTHFFRKRMKFSEINTERFS